MAIEGSKGSRIVEGARVAGSPPIYLFWRCILISWTICANWWWVLVAAKSENVEDKTETTRLSNHNARRVGIEGDLAVRARGTSWKS